MVEARRDERDRHGTKGRWTIHPSHERETTCFPCKGRCIEAHFSIPCHAFLMSRCSSVGISGCILRLEIDPPIQVNSHLIIEKRCRMFAVALQAEGRMGGCTEVRSCEVGSSHGRTILAHEKIQEGTFSMARVPTTIYTSEKTTLICEANSGTQPWIRVSWLSTKSSHSHLEEGNAHVAIQNSDEEFSYPPRLSRRRTSSSNLVVENLNT